MLTVPSSGSCQCTLRAWPFPAAAGDGAYGCGDWHQSSCPSLSIERFMFARAASGVLILCFHSRLKVKGGVGKINGLQTACEIDGRAE